MPSLRQKVTGYFRQLSFIAEPRDVHRNARKTEDDGNFITKYLEGRMERIFVPAPEIFNGNEPTDLPELKIACYATGPNTITAACTGPEEGLTGIKRSKLHLSASYADDIDFIDTIQEDCFEVRKSITTTASSNNRYQQNKFNRSRRQSGATTPTNDQNANKTFTGMRSRKNSKTGISNLSQSSNKAAVLSKSAAAATSNTAQKLEDDNAHKSTTIVVSMVSRTGTPNKTATTTKTTTTATNDNINFNNAQKTDRPTSIAASTATITTTTTNINNSNAKNAQTKDLLQQTVAATTTKTSATIDDNTTKLLEDTTERLLRDAVTSQSGRQDAIVGIDGNVILSDAIASVSNWKMETESAYGISVSLYENNMLTKEPVGNPIADCYGMVARGNAAIMAIADGVNWGDGARLAARSAVHGCLDYLDRAIFGLAPECMATTTQEVFVSLLRSIWEGHGCILEVGGALSTLTIAVVLPLSAEHQQQQQHIAEGVTEKYVVCACNVGDSLGYVYSKKHGVREFTQASHDISSNRDMRDALGALGPADGNKPELSNLTLSMTLVERDDIIFLTTDGISDNFDPVVGKFAEAWTSNVKLLPSNNQAQPALAPKHQNKSASDVYGARLQRNNSSISTSSTAAAATNVPPKRPARLKQNSNTTTTASIDAAAAGNRPKYLRSHTVIETRHNILRASNNKQHAHNSARHTSAMKIPKSVAGLPLITAPQRHALTLHRLEDLLSFGINGTFAPCSSARRLCQLLIDFVRMISSARRKTLEQRELFYKLATGPDGIKREVELNRMQHRAARKRVVDSSAFIALPGKLDHASVVAYTVGSAIAVDNNSDVVGGTAALLQSKEFDETNF